jgi:ribonucleoside-diphosphate reductase alpha chain
MLTSVKNKQNLKFDFDKLIDVTKQIVLNLNKIIDINFYPTEGTKLSNLKHRPIGIGIQGLADTFAMLNYPFDSGEAKQLNKEIFETIYYAAMTVSIDLAKKDKPYDTFKGSPLSDGMFQFDLWGAKPSERYDWEKLKERVIKNGARNSLLLAPMPTASTAQILGNNECFEPFTTNMYKRNTLGGEFIVINKHLISDLIKLGLWDEELRLKMFEGNGSIQHIESIPDEIKLVYRTVWEIPQKSLIDMAADRAIYICQSQSMNLFMKDVNIGKLNSALFYTWNKKLKTGMYYLRTLAKSEPLKGLGVDASRTPTPEKEVACTLDSGDGCESCGS